MTTTKTYQHLQPEDRMLGRSASTVSREFRRNTLAALPYASHSAQLSCNARRQAARPAAKLDLHGVGWSVVLTLLDWKWSPQQTSRYPQARVC
jgi:IS30 family transposase